MEGGKMSEPNEPPLALDSWHITVKLNDGTDFKLEPDDLPLDMLRGIEDVVNEGVEFRIDHLKGKYAGEVSDHELQNIEFLENKEAEDLHAQNSKRFVDYEKKSD